MVFRYQTYTPRYFITQAEKKVRNISSMGIVEMDNADDNLLWTKIQLRENQKLFKFLILEVSAYGIWQIEWIWNPQKLTCHTQKPILGHKKFEISSNGSKVMALWSFD